MGPLNIEQIQEVLPQRYPILMIDRVVELEPGKKVTAIKNVTINEPYFAGHFPQKPVMPGVLIIEAMAQAAIMLFYTPEKMPSPKEQSYYLVSVKTRFFHPVFPGEQLKVTVTPLKLISSAAIVSAVAEVADKEVARAELSFSVKKYA